MSSVISVENLSKVYRIGLKDEIPDTFVGAVTGWLKAPFTNYRRLRQLGVSDEQQPTKVNQKASSVNRGTSTNNHQPSTVSDTIWALRDVSFEVYDGEVLGIIGRNGAGKSTLLKILTRITEPTMGRAVVSGRVSSLLEVGTGFHPELTGRENIYMNGTILGMRKREIDRKFDEIVDFSGVEKHLDTPIKRYSSGMQVRLAFAVAAHLEPEILVVDEVLAVGDAEFQKKCVGKMQDVASGGRTVLFVSHNMGAVEALCHRGIQIDRGRLVSTGSIEDVIAYYHKDLLANSAPASRHVANNGLFRQLDILNEQDQPTAFVPIGQDVRIRLTFNPDEKIESPRIYLGIDDLFGRRLVSVQPPVNGNPIGRIDGLTMLDCTIHDLLLAPGTYSFSLVILENRQVLENLQDVARLTIVNAELFGEGRGFEQGVCAVRSTWNRLEKAAEIGAR